MNIPFNKAPVIGNELSYISEALKSNKLSGDGCFSKKSEKHIEMITGCCKVLLTPSCTAALELAAILCDLKEGDEVIVPSYTFVSTANAFALRGAKIIFVDIIPATMNIDPDQVRNAITPMTKVIVPVHYAGVACDMDAIMSIAQEHNIVVVEDAAQAIGSYYKGKALGTIGHIGAFSFHETKNITSGGEGGAILINDTSYLERAEIIREKGTNRNQYFRGQVDKYSWIDIGSSFLPSEIQAAYLLAQLKMLNEINANRIEIYNQYRELLSPLVSSGLISLPYIPSFATNNGHMFYIKCSNFKVRSELIEYLKGRSVMSAFHYVPLHSSKMGLRSGLLRGEDTYTTKESERLLRLPMYYSLSTEHIEFVCDTIQSFYNEQHHIID